MEYNTLFIKNAVLEQPSANDLVEFVRRNEADFISWQRYISQLVRMYGNSYERFGKMCGFSKNTVKSWCLEGKLPKNRDMFIRLAFGLRMSVQETSVLLSKYGKYSALYAKDLYDAIIIYIISRRAYFPDEPSYSFDSIPLWVEKFKEIRLNRTINPYYYSEPSTLFIQNGLTSITDDGTFEQYILANKDVFLSTYSGLVAFIESFINIRRYELEDRFDPDPASRYSWHRMVKEKGLDSSFEKMLSVLRTQGIVPRREQLIALGIHLNMVSADINNMLRLANMQPLYARDKAESMILYLLRNAERIDPDLQFNNASKFYEQSSDRALRAQYGAMITHYLGTDEVYSEDGIEDLADYMRSQLSALDINELLEGLL